MSVKDTLNRARQAGRPLPSDPLQGRKGGGASAGPVAASAPVFSPPAAEPAASPPVLKLSPDILPDDSAYGRIEWFTDTIGLSPQDFETGKAYMLFVEDGRAVDGSWLGKPLVIFEHDHVFFEHDHLYLYGANETPVLALFMKMLSDFHVQDVYGKLGRTRGIYAQYFATSPADPETGKVAWINDDFHWGETYYMCDSKSPITGQSLRVKAFGEDAPGIVARERDKWRVVRDWTGQFAPKQSPVDYLKATRELCGNGSTVVMPPVP